MCQVAYLVKTCKSFSASADGDEFKVDLVYPANTLASAEVTFRDATFDGAVAKARAFVNAKETEAHQRLVSRLEEVGGKIHFECEAEVLERHPPQYHVSGTITWNGHSIKGGSSEESQEALFRRLVAQLEKQLKE